jgi:hypothetical protein
LPDRLEARATCKQHHTQAKDVQHHTQAKDVFTS